MRDPSKAPEIAANLQREDPELLREPILGRLATQLERATAAVDSGLAAQKLDDWVAATNR